MDIFLLMGQSNMAGRGLRDEVDPIEHPGIFMFRDGEWPQAEEPLHRDRAHAGIGLAMSFAEELVMAQASRVIGLVPCALGGSRLDQWEPGAYLYRRALFEAGEVARSGEVRGLLWHQGESDSCDRDTAVTYGARLVEMLTAFRGELADEGIPVVVGELGRFLEGVPQFGEFETVNQALNDIPGRLARSACVSSEGLADKGDRVHFNSVALREFGRRYAHAYQGLVGAGTSHQNRAAAGSARP